MALLQTFEPLAGFVADNAYHHIAAIGMLDYATGSVQCRIASYKDTATREAYKALLAELQTLSAESEALHEALSLAQQEQDQMKLATVQRDIAVKNAEITVKAEGLAQLQPCGSQEMTLTIKDVLAEKDDITRLDLYAKLKEQAFFKDAVDA